MRHAPSSIFLKRARGDGLFLRELADVWRQALEVWGTHVGQWQGEGMGAHSAQGGGTHRLCTRAQRRRLRQPACARRAARSQDGEAHELAGEVGQPSR